MLQLNGLHTRAIKVACSLYVSHGSRPRPRCYYSYQRHRCGLISRTLLFQTYNRTIKAHGHVTIFQSSRWTATDKEGIDKLCLLRGSILGRQTILSQHTFCIVQTAAKVCGENMKTPQSNNQGSWTRHDYPKLEMGPYLKG